MIKLQSARSLHGIGWLDQKAAQNFARTLADADNGPFRSDQLAFLAVENASYLYMCTLSMSEYI